MLTNAEMRDIVVQNLYDIRIFSIQAFLTRLIKRKIHGNGIEEYRIYDKVTNTNVTSLNDFITKISAKSLHADYFYYSGSMSGDCIHPFAICLSNFTITIDRNSDEDSIYFNMFGSEIKNILLLLNYLSDGDTIIPLKIYEIRLIK